MFLIGLVWQKDVGWGRSEASCSISEICLNQNLLGRRFSQWRSSCLCRRTIWNVQMSFPENVSPAEWMWEGSVMNCKDMSATEFTPGGARNRRVCTGLFRAADGSQKTAATFNTFLSPNTSYTYVIFQLCSHIWLSCYCICLSSKESFMLLK